MQSLIHVVAVISAGLYAGIIFGDRVGASDSRAKLEPSAFIVFQQVQHLHFKPILMPLTIVALATSLLWAALAAQRWRQAEFWLAAAAALATGFAFVVTRSVNFPINDALMTWSAAAPPRNLRELWAPWEAVHTLRAAAAVLAFALQASALGWVARHTPRPSHELFRGLAVARAGPASPAFALSVGRAIEAYSGVPHSAAPGAPSLDKSTGEQPP